MLLHLKDDLHLNTEYLITVGLQVNNNTANVIGHLINGKSITLLTFATEAEGRKALHDLVKNANVSLVKNV